MVKQSRLTDASPLLSPPLAPIGNYKDRTIGLSAPLFLNSMNLTIERNIPKGELIWRRGKSIQRNIVPNSSP